MKKSNALYYLKNVRCSYNGSREVLQIDELNLPKGKILFVVGLSGVGKSTMLETLACMHNCLVDSEDAQFELNISGKELSLMSTWKRGEKAISELRKQYFSFIFQQSTFLEDCTAMENMALGAMIKGIHAEEVEAEILEWMERLDLPTEESGKNIRRFSGGQRQRMAFIRALVSPFELLFCDEPTGNLDAHTGQVLMQCLKDFIRKSGKTAIVVTHDLRSSLKHADQILVIRPKEFSENGLKQTMGWVSDRTYFEMSERREARDVNRLLESIKTLEK